MATQELGTTASRAKDALTKGYVDNAVLNASGKPPSFKAVIGNGTTGPFTVNHNLGTREVGVEVYKYGVGGTWESVLVRVDRVDANNVMIRPDEVWAANSYRVLIVFISQSDVIGPTAPVISYVSKDAVSITAQLTTASVDTDSGVNGYYWLLDGLSQSSSPVPTAINTPVVFGSLGNSSTHTITMIGVDNEGNNSPVSNAITQTTNSGGDVTAPTAGTAAFSTATYTTITYTFTAGTDNVGVDHINAYDADGITLLASNVTSPWVRGNSTSPNAPLTINTSYGTLFRYYDAAGNHADSGIVTHNTAADTTAPTAGVATVGTVATNSIAYTFTAGSDDVGVVGVDAYDTGGTLLTSNVTSPYTRSSLTPNTSYGTFFRFRDAAGNHADSNTITQTTSTSSDVTAPTPGTGSYFSSTTSTIVYTFTSGSDNVGVDHINAYDQDGVTLLASNVSSPFTRGSGTGNNAALTANTSYGTIFRYYDAAGNHADSGAVVHSTAAASANVAFGAVGTGSRNITSPTNGTDSVVASSAAGGYLLGIGWISHSATNSDPTATSWDSLTVTDSAGDTWTQIAGITAGSFSSSQLGTLVVMAKASPSAATHNTTFTPVKSALGTISSIQWVTGFYTGVGSVVLNFSSHPTSGTNIGQSPTISAGSVAVNLVISSAAITAQSPSARYYAGGSVTGNGDYALYQDAASSGGGTVSFAGTNSNIIGQIILELKKAP